MTAIEKNVVARVHYTGTLPESGEVFDSSEGRDHLPFSWPQANDPRFREELIGATKGERRTFTLEPERATVRKFQKQSNKFQLGCLETLPLNQA